MDTYSLTHVPDGALIRNLTALAHQDRKTTAVMLAHIAEMDERRLWAPAGYSSMFDYCVRELGFSEDVACKRIRVARVGRTFRGLLTAIAQGRLHLAGAALIAPHVTAENADDLIGAASGMTKAKVETLVAERFPRNDVATRVRALPTRVVPAEVAQVQFPQSAPGRIEPSSPATASAIVNTRDVAPLLTLTQESQNAHVAEISRPPRSQLRPIAPKRFALQTTLNESAHGKLRYLQKLLSHQVPAQDVPEVLERAFDALIEKLEKAKFGTKNGKPKPSRNPRYVPKSVRRAVWERDQGRCTFVSDTGVRCTAETRLELDHVLAVARGGESTIDNLRLRCRAHNQYAAECTFGAGFMAAKRGHGVVRERPAPGYAASPLPHQRVVLSRLGIGGHLFRDRIVHRRRVEAVAAELLQQALPRQSESPRRLGLVPARAVERLFQAPLFQRARLGMQAVGRAR